MKLSTAINKWKKQGMARGAALLKAKLAINKIAQRWSKGKQKLFDEIWDEPVSNSTIKNIEIVPKQPELFSIEQKGVDKITYFKGLLKSCGFSSEHWNDYGLHYKVAGNRQPPEIKKALLLLAKAGFKRINKAPSVLDTAKDKSEAVWYKDANGNSANTVSNISTNGKDDYQILNITFSLTPEERSKLNPYAQQLNTKHMEALKKADQGVFKPKHKGKAPWEMSYKEYLKQSKGTQSYRDAIKEFGTEGVKQQWISSIEKASKDGKRIPKIVLDEYHLQTLKTGAIYNLPLSKVANKQALLDGEKITKIKNTLIRKGVATVRSDDDTLFTLTTEPIKGGIKCERLLCKVLGQKTVFAIRGRIIKE